MEYRENEINRIAVELEYGGRFEPLVISRIINLQAAVICDIAEELGGPDRRAQYAGKLVGFAAIMKAALELEDSYPNITPYIAGRVEGLLRLGKPR